MSTPPSPPYQGGRKITLIAALGKHFEIGEKNQLLWNLPEDMKHFRETTKGKTVVMGRKTFESIGRPLPNRRNIVLTRDKHFSQEGIEVLYSVNDVLALLDDIFIIGGAEIYTLFLPYATHLSITHVEAEFPHADAFFPQIDFAEWEELSRNHFPQNEAHEYAFDIVEYKKDIRL